MRGCRQRQPAKAGSSPSPRRSVFLDACGRDPLGARLASRNASTAASSVGKKCDGSIVRVSSYRSILRRTGSFISAKTRWISLALSSSSMSRSMSAAVVSTSVIGSAATMIHLGAWLGPRELADLFAERPRVREDQRRVEPEDHTTRAAVRHSDSCVRRGNPGTPGTRPRIVWYGHHARRKTLPIERATATTMPGSTPSATTPRKAAIDSANSVAPQAVEPQRARDVGQRDRCGDHHRGQRRLRQVAQHPGGQQQDQRDRGRSDQPGDLRLGARLLAPRRFGNRSC